MLYIKKLLVTILLFSSVASICASSITLNEKLSNWITFEVEANIQSFQITIESHNPDANPYFADLVNPSGEVLIKNNTLSPSRHRIPPKIYSTIRNRIRPTYVHQQLFSVVVDKQAVRGTWKFRLAQGDSGVSNIRWRIQEFKSPSIVRPKLSLKLGISKNFKYISQSQLNSALDRVKKLYKGYGIEVQFEPQLDWSDPEESQHDLEKKLAAISAQRSGVAGLYLVNRIGARVQKDFQGLAGCLPGFSTNFAKAHCALIVSMEDKPVHEFNSNKLTKVIAHEMAHLLGLFHLEDDYFPFGKLFDPFDDTEIETDHTNIMHKTSEFFGALEFSPSQVEKLLSSPLLYQ